MDRKGELWMHRTTTVWPEEADNRQEFVNSNWDEIKQENN